MIKPKTAFKQTISSIIIMAILCSVTTFSTSAATDYQSQIDQLESQINANNSKNNNDQSSIEDLADQIATMQEQLDVYNSKITDLNKQIAEKNAVIEKYQAEIDRLQSEMDAATLRIQQQTEEINKTYDLLKERLRAAYISGETSTLEVLLGSSDYESFLTRLELVSQVSKHDTQLVKGLQNEIDELNKTKEQLVADQKSQQESQDSVTSERALIETARAEVQTVAGTLDKKQSALESQVKSLKNIISSRNATNDALEAKMAKLEAQSIANTSGSSGSGTLASGMSFPLRCNYYVSQHYGNNGHKGVDLAGGGINGQPVYATASGKVISAEYHSSWGNNVLIDHGNGVWTRYAHLSSIGVSAGQSISQGQYLGNVGSTGNSSGPHLHFEVYVNGNRVNPEPYIGL